MRALPPAARLYVGSVIAIGAALVVWLGPKATFDDPLLFLALLALSAITSAFKVSLPLDRSGSTMSVSYAVDFAALLMLVLRVALDSPSLAELLADKFTFFIPLPLFDAIISLLGPTAKRLFFASILVGLILVAIGLIRLSLGRVFRYSYQASFS